MERTLPKVSTASRGRSTGRITRIWVLQRSVIAALMCAAYPALASTSFEFGLSPLELGRLQTPHTHGNQIFSHPTAVADYERLTVQGFLAGRYFARKPEQPTGQLGAAIYIPLAPPGDAAWLASLGFALGNPVHGLFRAMGSTRPATPDPQSTESLDLRTTLNSRPHPKLDLAIGLRSLAKLVGSIDVTVVDSGNKTFVINRLLTTFRPELEARWSSGAWALQAGYRERLVIDYDVPIQASLEDPVPLDLPLLSIRGVAFIEPRSAWVGGFWSASEHRVGWQVTVRLPDAQGIGLSGLTPSEERPLPALPRQWLASLSIEPNVEAIAPLTLTHGYGLRLSEQASGADINLRAGFSAHYKQSRYAFAFGCSTELQLNLTPNTLVCSFGIDTPWEPSP